jgi:nuclear pore complex protein Nup62
MVDSVNSLSNKETADEDPMVQIAQILNSHLESLQWIDGTASEVEAQVNEIERAIRENGSGMSTGKTRMFNQALKR